MSCVCERNAPFVLTVQLDIREYTDPTVATPSQTSPAPPIAGRLFSKRLRCWKCLGLKVGQTKSWRRSHRISKAGHGGVGLSTLFTLCCGLVVRSRVRWPGRQSRSLDVMLCIALSLSFIRYNMSLVSFMLSGAPGIATRSKDATRGSWPYY